MSKPWILLVAALFASIFSGIAPAQEFTYKHKAQNYEVCTNVKPEIAVRVVEHLEDVRVWFDKILKLRGKHKNKVNKVVLLPSLVQYKDYLKSINALINIDFQFVRGLPGDAKNQLVCYVMPDKSMFKYLTYVAFDQYVGEHIQYAPSWLQRGLAAYFLFARFNPEKGFTCEPPSGPIRYLREGILDIDPGPWNDWIQSQPLSHIITLRGNDFNENVVVNEYTSWALAYYIFHKAEKKLKKRYLRAFNVCKWNTSFEVNAIDEETIFYLGRAFAIKRNYSKARHFLGLALAIGKNYEKSIQNLLKNLDQWEAQD
jgi:hypothetical protein